MATERAPSKAGVGEEIRNGQSTVSQCDSLQTSSIKNLMITPEFQANCVDTVGENEPDDEMAVDAVSSEPVSR
jgi:hypothetical protein